jgi:methenyltetrahydromethanopterin cyclohydrolase
MNLNNNAVKIALEMLAMKGELGVKSLEIGGAMVIDCGVKAKGSFEAGRLFIKACMGGLAEVSYYLSDFGLPMVMVSTAYPALACMGAQKAGWRVKEGDYSALASGPGRILARKPRATYEKLGYEEKAEHALIALEAARYPSLEVVEKLAQACGMAAENLYLLVARTASLVGAMQVSGRAAETALYRLDKLGYDINRIDHVVATAPVAPLLGDDARMMGACNDMIIYGSRVYLSSKANIEVEKIPSCNSPAYGRPFEEIYREAGFDFYKIDQGLFAPAEVYLNDSAKGKLRKAGRVNFEVIKRSVGI